MHGFDGLSAAFEDSFSVLVREIVVEGGMDGFVGEEIDDFVQR